MNIMICAKQWALIVFVADSTLFGFGWVVDVKNVQGQDFTGVYLIIHYLEYK